MNGRIVRADAAKCAVGSRRWDDLAGYAWQQTKGLKNEFLQTLILFRPWRVGALIDGYHRPPVLPLAHAISRRHERLRFAFCRAGNARSLNPAGRNGAGYRVHALLRKCLIVTV